jgi:hypothetical protein
MGFSAAASAHTHHGLQRALSGRNLNSQSTDLTEAALNEADDMGKDAKESDQQAVDDDTEGYNEDEDYLYIFPPKSKRKGDLSMKILMSGYAHLNPSFKETSQERI